MKIRKIKRSDLMAVARLTAEFEAFIGEIEHKPRRIKPSKIARQFVDAGFGESKFFDGIVAEENETMIGTALFSRSVHSESREKVFLVVDLFVTELARGRGIGTALMSELRRRAKQEGCKRLSWNVWNRNPRALKFYLDLGAETIDDELMLTWKI